MYFSHGGSIRFAVGFVAGVLLREAAARKGKRPPRSLLVAIGGSNNGDAGRGGGDEPGSCDESGPLVLVRQLEAGDHDKGFLELLSQLTSVGNVNKEKFLARVTDIRAGPEYVFVIEENGKIIATDKARCEHVFTQTKNVLSSGVSAAGAPFGGLVVIRALMRVAERLGCYKVILDCAEKNQPFYEKCGMTRKEVQMAKYFLDP